MTVRPLAAKAPRTAFVLAGGGSLGAIQVGMLRALSDAGIAPDLVVGTSVGAINAGFIAAGAGPEDIAALRRTWLGVKREDVFPVSPFRGLSALLTHGDALFSPNALRRLLAAHLRYERLEDAPIPVALVGADIVSGREVVLRSGDAVDAMLASAAIPGIFPPVAVGGLELVDGGMVNHTPISTAVDLGASTVYVLPTGYPCALAQRPRGALAVALLAVTNLLSQRLFRDIAVYREQVDLRVVPPPCPVSVSAADFGRTAMLIRGGEERARAWLAADMPGGGEAMLEPHHLAGVTTAATARQAVV